jgi:hypothetical protein
MLIDTSFDFRTDAAGKDPDSHSITLCQYHKLLWSKALPSGVLFGLEASARRPYFLHHRSELGEFSLTSDSITHTYRKWVRMQHIIREFSKEEIEAFFALGYTIGAMLVFPKNMVEGKPTINGARGCHAQIADRFDLTLECIRRHYLGQHSPLADTLQRYVKFFALFGDFEGYVDYFLLQDLMDGGSVKFLLSFDDFQTSPLPGSIDAYKEYKRLTIEFVEARNRRIDRYASCKGTRAIGQIQLPRGASISPQTTPHAVLETAEAAAEVAPTPRRARTEMTEAQALAEAQALYGADAMVWCITEDLKGQSYKTPRYRVGYKAQTETGRFIENGRRMKGVGGSWTEAVYSAKTFATPRMVEAPKQPEPSKGHAPKAE